MGKTVLLYTIVRRTTLQNYFCKHFLLLIRGKFLRKPYLLPFLNICTTLKNPFTLKKKEELYYHQKFFLRYNDILKKSIYIYIFMGKKFGLFSKHCLLYVTKSFLSHCVFLSPHQTSYYQYPYDIYKINKIKE